MVQDYHDIPSLHGGISCYESAHPSADGPLRGLIGRPKGPPARTSIEKNWHLDCIPSEIDGEEANPC
jgi:hypothetical protein